MSGDDTLFEFAPEMDEGLAREQAWRVLTVEDNQTYQASLIHSLKQIIVDDKALEIIQAQSREQAVFKLTQIDNIAVVLLDVVMEERDAGLKLISYIREKLNNYTTRIILLTGQPGSAPNEQVLKHYDIDDYWDKTDLTETHLNTIITSNIRTWRHLCQLHKARAGLSNVVAASQRLSSIKQVDVFGQAVLEELGQIIDSLNDGIMSIRLEKHVPLTNACIIAATGLYQTFRGKKLTDISEIDVLETIKQSAESQQHVFNQDYTALYFRVEHSDEKEYIALVKSSVPLDQSAVYLLRVFSENVATGFNNILLNNYLAELAFKTPVTGLNNRNWLINELESIAPQLTEKARLYLIELDNFAEIGVMFGEGLCNELLIAIYSRLTTDMASNDIAHISRDCIAVLVYDEQHYCDEIFFQRLFERPITVSNRQHKLSATVVSVELARVVQHDPGHILRQAESTISRAKQQHTHYLEFDVNHIKQITRRYTLLNELDHALKNDELSIVLQPKVQLASNKVVGFEALARWYRDDGSQVSPAEFIPLAETSGMIRQLDRLILTKVCQAARQLQAAGIYAPIAFNASGDELTKTDYFQELLSFIQSSGVGPSMLELEMTETLAMRDFKRIARQLRALIQSGMGVSIDDFGTGYSSLAYITELSATTLKIDRTFVSQVDTSIDAEHVVDMILKVGLRFGFTIVAEGIETEQQYRRLLEMGCDVGQGFYFSPGLAVDSAIEWTKQYQSG